MTYWFTYLGSLALVSNGVGVFGISLKLFESFMSRCLVKGDRLVEMKARIPKDMTLVDFMDVFLEAAKKTEL